MSAERDAVLLRIKHLMENHDVWEGSAVVFPREIYNEFKDDFKRLALTVRTSDPCPSKTRPFLGEITNPNGVLISCGLMDGHAGDHEYAIRWSR